LEVKLKTRLGFGVVKKNIHKRRPWHYYKGALPPFFPLFLSYSLSFFFSKTTTY
jgi:hypothetical protein